MASSQADPVRLYDDSLPEQSWRRKLGSAGRLLWRDWSGLLGLTLFITIVLSAVFAPLIAPHDPARQNLRASKLPPAWADGGSWEHPMGTDTLGRDLFSRIVYGARVSLTVGFFGVLIALSLGLLLGLTAGYFGGRVDNVIMGVSNVFLALPYLLFVVVIASILGRSLLNVILIFGITDAPLFIRITRGEVLRIRQSGYVESAVSIGASRRRIIFSHILPNLSFSNCFLRMFFINKQVVKTIFAL
jgi:ABC-type dipeptide/oligopeptide/nickel transport system permease subunit